MGYAVAFRPRALRAARGATLTAAALAALAACGSGGTDPVPGDPFTRRGESLIAGGLRQEVSVRVAGDTASIRSVVYNVGDAPVTVEARICGLEVDPVIAWADEVRCGGYSMRRPLAPGDSVVERDRRRLAGAPAAVRVRHLIDPSVWVTVQLR